MPEYIHVTGRHPLSRFAIYPRLKSAGVHTTSVQMTYAYLFLIHHQRPDLAQELLQNDSLKWDPVLIEPWLQQKGIVPNARFVAYSNVIYHLIVSEQMRQKDGPIRKAARVFMESISDRSNVEFLVYTSAKTRETLYSTGQKLGEPVDDYPGENLYGEILGRAYAERKEPVEVVRKNLTEFADLTDFLQPAKRSVLILSDSQARYFDSVSCRGLVVPVSGGRYCHLVDAIESGEFCLDDFLLVIVYCGTNTYLRPNYPEYQRQSGFYSLKRLLVKAAETRQPGTILFSCAFDHPKVYGNHVHARWVTEEFQNTPIKCINYRDAGNPFLDEGGQKKQLLFRPDGFHLNTDGAKLLWKKFIEIVPSLKFFMPQFSDLPSTVNHQHFQSDAPGPSKRQKRNQ